MNIRQEDVPFRKRVACLGAWLAVSGMLLLPGHGIAQLVTLTDGGSTATINPYSSVGMNSWTVDGQNQLNRQWFWYQVNGGIIQSVDTIGTPFLSPNGANEITALYQNAQLSISIDYYLQGGGVGSGNADITESIMAVNNSGSSMNFNFYQYSNFNLLGVGNDNVQIFGSPGAYNYVRQWNGSTAIGEAIVSPYATFAEAGVYNQSGFDPSNPSGPLNDNLTAGAGDVTWALEWNAALAADGGEFDLTKDKSLSIQVIPEPGTTALAVLGGLCLAGWTVRRRRA